MNDVHHEGFSHHAWLEWNIYLFEQLPDRFRLSFAISISAYAM